MRIVFFPGRLDGQFLSAYDLAKAYDVPLHQGVLGTVATHTRQQGDVELRTDPTGLYQMPEPLA